MKFNKIFLGLGVMGLALTACSDDVEYTPAEAVNTPPVYFSDNDESNVDLEEDASYFTIKAYRQNTSGESDGTVDVTLSAADGTNATSLFTIGTVATLPLDQTLEAGQVQLAKDEENETQSVFVPTKDVAFDATTGKASIPVHFTDGEGETDIAFYFGSVSNLTQMVAYNFNTSVAGESSPYYITSINYAVQFTPWETITEGPVILRDYVILAPSTAGRQIEFEVTCQKHPIKKDFFRLLRPYEQCGYGQYVLPLDNPNYLYINAANPSEVFFSDKNGNYQLMYDTGVKFYSGVEGTIKIACNYCYNKTQTNLTWADGVVNIPYSKLSGAGEYQNGRISFGENLTVLLPGIEGYWPSKGWTLIFPWAPSEWESLGKATYTDGFIAEYFGYPALTYEVEMEQHTETPSMYRLVGPYAFGVWPSEIAANWPEQYNLIINCEDPNFVIIEEQQIFDDGETSIVAMNADFAMTNYYGPKDGNRAYTKDEVIEMGLNDKLEEGVITINHPMIGINGSTDYVFLWEDTNWHTPTKIVLPVNEDASGVAAKAPAGDAARLNRSTMRR